jgi:outer membrane biosynthesis protein TonB
LADGPLQFEQVDKETFIPNMVTKYGKEFSIVEVPYCLKLLMHELTTMNVQMRLITADTIDILTKGTRSLGNFETWTKKEAPEVLEKSKIEKLLNQPLSDDEYKAIVEPVTNNEIEEYEPVPNENRLPMILEERETQSVAEPVPQPLPVPPPVPVPQPVPVPPPVPQVEASSVLSETSSEPSQESSQESGNVKKISLKI